MLLRGAQFSLCLSSKGAFKCKASLSEPKEQAPKNKP